jgi:hypothetical protein
VTLLAQSNKKTSRLLVGSQKLNGNNPEELLTLNELKITIPSADHL